ncbi:MAG: hypothetical protein WAV11_02640 [Minisyncoccia bacterium]
MKNEEKKTNQMRIFLLFILILIIINFIFELNFSYYIWVILFFLVCFLALVQVLDRKLRALSDRISKLEKKDI